MTRSLDAVQDEPVTGAARDASPSAGRTPTAVPTSGVTGRASNDVRAAFALLTRVPMGNDIVSGTGVRAYGLVGALLGGAALLPLVGLGSQMPIVAAILAVAVLAIGSGGLHLDGLADTFDALVAVGPDAAERARRDPAIGAAGATALILIMGLDVALLAGPLMQAGPLLAGLACVAAGAVSRSTPAVVALVARSAAGSEGLAAWFVRAVRGTEVAVTVASAAVLVLGVGFLAGRAALAVGGLAGLVASVVVGLAVVRLRGRLDGDGLGASVELGFASSLLATATLVAVLPPAI